MADKKPKKRVLKKTETVRERAAKPKKEPKARKLSSAKAKVGGRIKKVAAVGQREYYLPMPDNKVGRFLNKRRSFIPRYFIESWEELKQVDWPSRKQTVQLSTAVFIFAIAIGVLVALVDYGLGLAFERFILK